VTPVATAFLVSFCMYYICKLFVVMCKEQKVNVKKITFYLLNLINVRFVSATCTELFV